ncbi:hypothetical protein [Mesobacterium pallidum]|uniref:hypothetical protein n=1 Tax=Mesobacterium pallidum TaxID=2872037 RepID=UPI001EE30F2E|nr:hypothetical protein [Mesobacterium pallidum]
MEFETRVNGRDIRDIDGIVENLVHGRAIARLARDAGYAQTSGWCPAITARRCGAARGRPFVNLLATLLRSFCNRGAGRPAAGLVALYAIRGML